MQVGRNASSVRARILLLDAVNAPITGKAFDDVDLELEILAHDGVGYSAQTLVEGTVGTYLSNSWIEIDGGTYEYGVPNGSIVKDKQTVIRARVGSAPWRYLSIEVTAFDETDLTAINDAIAAITTATSSTTTVIQTDQSSTNANAQWPLQGLQVTATTDDQYIGTTWSMTFRGLPTVPGGEEIVFALKSDLADDDTESIIEVEYDVTGNTTTITRLNGAAGSGTATGVYQTDTTDATKKELILTIDDAVTAQIAAGTYHRGLKRVGTSAVLLQDTQVVKQPVTQAVAP